MALTTKQIVALLSLPSVGKAKVTQVCSLTSTFLSDEELFDALQYLKISYKDESKTKKPITQDVLQRALDNAEELVLKSEREGIQILSCCDKQFPNCLKVSLDFKEQQDKKDKTKYSYSKQPPLLISYKGNLQLLDQPKIAIIGSRKSIPEAEKAAFYLAKELADRDIAILSGLALGIDTFAHQGCLASIKGKAIGVVGNGLDIFYPKQNKELIEKILEQDGLLITENLLGEAPQKYTMIDRDIVQGIVADSTLVVQAKENSGSIHAATITSNLNKHLYVVKYSNDEINELPEMSGNRYLVENLNGQYLSAVKDKEQMKVLLDQLSFTVQETFTKNK